MKNKKRQSISEFTYELDLNEIKHQMANFKVEPTFTQLRDHEWERYMNSFQTLSIQQRGKTNVYELYALDEDRIMNKIGTSEVFDPEFDFKYGMILGLRHKTSEKGITSLEKIQKVLFLSELLPGGIIKEYEINKKAHQTIENNSSSYIGCLIVIAFIVIMLLLYLI